MVKSLDFYLFHQLNQFALKNLWLDTLFIFFAQYFEYILLFILLLFLVRSYKKYWPMVILALFAAILARFGIAEMIRYLLPRFRPFVENSVNLLINYPVGEPSFPSGHTSFYFALATVIYFYNKKAGVGFFLASFLISVSRVISGIHWPLDILIGAFVGIFSGMVIIALSRRFFPRFFSAAPK
jgi:undecaprenyl-diphosphatase